MSKFVPNSFQVPNAFVDEVLDKISDAACKMYLVVCRKTRGWQKEMDSISVTQFMEITGKSKPTVIRCMNELVKVGLVIETGCSIHGKTYKLGEETSVGQLIKFASKKNLLVKNFYPSSKNILPLLVKNFYPHKTTIKNNYQNKKKGWLVFKKLEEQILKANPDIQFSEIKNAHWFQRELEAFENYNLGKEHNNNTKLYFFADWLMNACSKYEKHFQVSDQPKASPVKKERKQNPPSETAQDKAGSQASKRQVRLSPKQVRFFANKLAHDNTFASQHAEAGEQHKDLERRLISKLTSPAYALKILSSLESVGYKHHGVGA
ncbi:replication protein [Acinetobacter sp. B5B]|uniref:replication protein n=1 Tax=Acinetobacter baretiae TaxID=2605383 RepID=UPI0018C334F7|nr:replication protein [Acinetobacter baretiae]MBF7683007.1 replication protein [Acinetobacter baretiae]